MSVEFDPSGDLASVADGLEPVTIVVPGSSATATVGQALRRAVSIREAQRSGGCYTAADVIWHLPAAELAESPRLGSVIVDGQARRWTVLESRSATINGRWRCVCRDLAVVHRLDDYVDVLQATYAKGQGGAAEATWHTWKTGLRARIQPALSEEKDQRLQPVTRSMFLIFLADDLALDHRHRIRGPDGIVYRITRARKAARIDALMEIDAVRVE